MAHPVRNQDRPEAYYETLKDRINAGAAVKVLNDVVATDKPIVYHKLQAAMFIINKLLPSMQAIAVQVEHKISASREDIMARALSKGIDPALLFHHKSLLLQDKSDSPGITEETPLPPDEAVD